ncbi:MAG: hemN [Bacteroidetes bacterium]|nr:hemN [Bacteroidota bacterium]
MSGLYIHIPFCRQKCLYCDFYSLATRESKKAYLEALAREWEQRKNDLDWGVKEPIKTIYIGGGTPSSLDKDEVKYLFYQILKDKTLFHPNLEEMEITFEANPENLSYDYLYFLKTQTPINRLSIGIQSFCDDDLKAIGRRHSALQAADSVQLAQKVGFKNISIDLIFALKNMTRERWEENLRRATELKVQHISAYCLTVEKGTMLNTLLEKGKITLPNEIEQEEQFLFTDEYLTKNKYEHYETSNYALVGYRSQHNSLYWHNKPYLGLGASAHSFNLIKRRWNVANVHEYIESVNLNKTIFEEEILSQKDHYNEYILSATRIKEGISTSYISENFSQEIVNHFLLQIPQLLQNNLLQPHGDQYLLTTKGILLSNQIAVSLFL